MKNHIKVLFLLAAVSFLSVSCMQAREVSSEGSATLDFQLQDLRQNTFTLSSYKEKQPVILFFWTTWCPFCRKELSILKEKYPQLQKDGCELFAIDVEESPYKVENFVKNRALNFKILLDLDAAVAEAFDIFGVPTYIFINKKGKIVYRDNYFPQERYKELISG